MIRCPKCGRRIAPKWLFLGLPWSSYTCPDCSSVLGGTVLRFVLTSVAVGLLGIVVIGVMKGRMTPTTLILPLALALAVFLLPLPGQIKRLA